MYRIEWIWPLAPIGVLILLTLPLVGVVFAGLVVLVFAVAILGALVGTIVALPFLLVRAVRRHGRSGRALPAHTGQPTASRASRLPAAARQAAAPKAPAALSSMSPGKAVTATRVA
jgi:hypothetical protein